MRSGGRQSIEATHIIKYWTCFSLLLLTHYASLDVKNASGKFAHGICNDMDGSNGPKLLFVTLMLDHFQPIWIQHKRPPVIAFATCMCRCTP